MVPTSIASRSFKLILLSLLWSALALPATAAPATAPAPVDIDDVPVTAPAVGKPQDRIGAGARDRHPETDPEVFLIAPTCTHGTAVSQPNLYWYLTRDTDVDIDFVIVEALDGDTPRAAPPVVLKKKYEGDQKAGLHSLSLAAEKISLKLNTQYKVTVMLLIAADNSKNPYSSGYVQYIARPPGLGEHPDGVACAGAGLWYDAIDTLANELKNPAAAVRARRQLCGMVWSQHVFYALPIGILAESADAEARDRAKAREAERLKQFNASIGSAGGGK